VRVDERERRLDGNLRELRLVQGLPHGRDLPGEAGDELVVAALVVYTLVALGVLVWLGHRRTSSSRPAPPRPRWRAACRPGRRRRPSARGGAVSVVAGYGAADTAPAREARPCPPRSVPSSSPATAGRPPARTSEVPEPSTGVATCAGLPSC
jgi:hypothetical protein